MLDPTLFDQAFNLLAVACRDTKSDAVTKAVYFEALRAFPAEIVRAAALRLVQEPGRKFFPTTGEWIDGCLTAKADAARLGVDVQRTDPWHHDCPDCEDVGWLQFLCDGSKLCGRRRPHAAHAYISACPCRSTNPTYSRHHEVPA